jgi:DNA-binding MarR family transcriptional regulator
LDPKRFYLLSPWPHEALEFAKVLERAGRALIAARRGVSLSFGVTTSGWRVLKTISESNVGLSTAEIARRLRLTRQTTHGIVRDLVSHGLVVTQRHATDRRVCTLALTAEATETLTLVESQMQRLLLEVTRDLPHKTLAVLTADLARMTGRISRCRSIVEKRVRSGVRAVVDVSENPYR